MSDTPSQSAPQNPSDEQPEDGPRGRTNAGPFLWAVGVMGVILIALVVSYIVRPTDSRMSTEARISRSLNTFYSSFNDASYAQFRDSVCEADRGSIGPEGDFQRKATESADRLGRITIDMKDFVVNGTSATVKVTTKYDKSGRSVTDTRTVVDEGGWKVCGGAVGKLFEQQ